MKIDVRPPATPEEWEQYYDLHYRVLREPLHMARIDQEVFNDNACAFGAAFQDCRIVSLARVKTVPEEGPSTGQIRGVATEPTYFRRGFGRAVMEYLEVEARKHGLDYIFLNARINAVDFYLSLGYAIEKDLGEYLPGVPHFRMGKKLMDNL